MIIHHHGFRFGRRQQKKRRSSMSPESVACKQKKRAKSAKHKYLKPGALAQLRYSRTTTRSCTDIGKKRVVVSDADDEKVDLFHKGEVSVRSNTPVTSPNRTMQAEEELGDETKQQMLPTTPKTPEPGSGTQSRLESLPIEILVQIMCHCIMINYELFSMLASEFGQRFFRLGNCISIYTTPDRYRQEMLRTKTPLPTEHWPFIKKRDGKSIWVPSPATPKAPKHGPRPPRLYKTEFKQTAAVLFRETTFPSKFAVPPGLPRPLPKPVASTRVLFYEDELCQAVAQNKLH